MIRAVFFDIDGTLVSFRTHRIPSSAMEALRAAHKNGVRLFIASGRAPFMLQAGNALQNYPFDGYVTFNGQLCYAGERVVRRRPIDREDIRRVLDILEEDPFPCLFMERDRWYVNRLDDRVREADRMANVPDPPEEDVRQALERDVFQMNFFLPEGGERRMLERLPNCAATRWSPYFSDIIPRDGSKRVGIQTLMDHFGLDRAEIMALGDGGNDIDMLRLAGAGVAMGNAAPEVRAAADFVTAPVDEDGVYLALKRFGVF